MKSRQRQLIQQLLGPLVSRWILIASCLLIAIVIGLIFYLCMPELYKCDALLNYEYQQIDSAPRIKKKENQQLQGIVNALSNNVFSRKNLTEIIEQFDLYPQSRHWMPEEDVVDLIRKQIRITFFDQGVTISYIGENREKVMNVTNALALKFVEESRQYSERGEGEHATYAKRASQDLQVSSGKHQGHKQIGYTFTVVESAHFPSNRYRPDLLIIMLVAIGSGLGGGVSLAYVLNLFDTSLKDAVEVERYLGLPVVCSVSCLELYNEIDRKQRVALHCDGWDECLTTACDVVGPVNESFRTLRTRIQHPMAGHSPRTLLVTSATSGEGKSFVCANLGISFSQGIDTPGILVDADLRKPSLAGLFGLPNGPGLVNYLCDEKGLDSLIVSAGVGKLNIIPAGLPPLHAVEPLGPESINVLITELGSRYGNSIVIFDAPPLDIGTDTIMLAKHVDAVILVVRWGTSRREHVRSLIDEIGQEKIAGVVFNAYKSNILERWLFGSCSFNKSSLY